LTSPPCGGARRGAEYHQKGLTLGAAFAPRPFVWYLIEKQMSNRKQIEITKEKLTITPKPAKGRSLGIGVVKSSYYAPYRPFGFNLYHKRACLAVRQARSRPS